ncbi:MAG: iron-containing redox enzyme family protein [Kofleriaceae bacterium]
MLESLHVALAKSNQGRFSPRLPRDDWRAELAEHHALAELEIEMVEAERLTVADAATAAPSDADGFLAWYARLAQVGPGQGDPLFAWLATTATTSQMQWFLAQEVAGEAGFEDLVALAQLKLPERPKLELARNYWDEMGRGQASAMHGPMLQRLAEAVDLAALAIPVVWETVALGNLMMALAGNRRYAYHALGALGVIELTAPGRAEQVNRGLKRLGIAPRARHYFALHATLDLEHSAAWNAEVLHPIVEREPAVARAIAEGALLRLSAGRRCFERYRRELWAHSQPSFASSASPDSRNESPMSLR